MGIRHYPEVKLEVSDISHSTAKKLVNHLCDNSDLNDFNTESRYERTVKNDDVKVDSYLQVEMKRPWGDDFITARHSGEDLEISWFGSMRESTDEFSANIELFETVIYESIADIVSEEKINIWVTSKPV